MDLCYHRPDEPYQMQKLDIKNMTYVACTFSDVALEISLNATRWDRVSVVLCNMYALPLFEPSVHRHTNRCCRGQNQFVCFPLKPGAAKKQMVENFLVRMIPFNYLMEGIYI